MPDQSWPGSTTTSLPVGADQYRSEKYASVSPKKDTNTESMSTKPKISLSNKGAIIGTWNVRTLYAAGRLKELTYALEDYQWDVIGVSEYR